MSPQDDFTRGSVQSYAEQWVAETPFLQTLTTVQEEDSRAAYEQEAPIVNSWYESETPFREGQELEGRYDLEAEDLAELLAELEHEGFNDAVNRLVNETSELY